MDGCVHCCVFHLCLNLYTFYLFAVNIILSFVIFNDDQPWDERNVLLQCQAFPRFFYVIIGMRPKIGEIQISW